MSSIPGRRVIILPGERPPPEKLEPPDLPTILRVLDGEAPKVCPACGRAWRAEAPCVCQEPEPVVRWWESAWTRLRALWAEPEPVVVYDAEIPRPKPPRPSRPRGGPS